MPIDQQTPGLPAVIRAALDARMMDVHTGIPGRIETYDASKLQASVQIEVRQARYDENGDRVPDRLPVVCNVPVIFSGGGGSRLTFPVKRGDQCWLMFSEASLDRWGERGGDVDPVYDRRHHIASAVCLVGLSDFGHARAAHATATVLEGDDVRIGDANAALLALKSDVENLRAYVYAQFQATLGHTHTVSGAATVAITAVAFNPPVGAPPTVLPNSVVGTTKAKGT